MADFEKEKIREINKGKITDFGREEEMTFTSSRFNRNGKRWKEMER